MANIIKITDLTAYAAPRTTDVIPIVDVTTDTTKKVTVGEVVGKITGDVDVATDGTSSIAAGAIVNADVNASAAIAGTKIAPDFGNQTIETTGVISSGRLLAGTSSWSGNNSKLVCAGNTGNASGVGLITAARGDVSANLSLDSEVGRYVFADLNGNDFARIGCFVDATPGATNDYPGRLVFSTTADGASSPTERMRITNDGSLSSFTTGGSVDVRNTRTTVSAFTAIGVYAAATDNTNGTLTCEIQVNGNIQNQNNSYGSLSDIKLKENIVDANSQWSDIKALQVRNYNFKEGQTHTQIGLIAQEVELVSPGLVSESPDRDEDGSDLGTVTKSVNYSVLYMKAVKALQEAMERIESLEAKIAALESA